MLHIVNFPSHRHISGPIMYSSTTILSKIKQPYRIFQHKFSQKNSKLNSSFSPIPSLFIASKSYRE